MRYLLATATAMLMGCGGAATSHEADLAEVQVGDMAGAPADDLARAPAPDMAHRSEAPDMTTPPDMTAPPKSATQGPCTRSSDCANFPPPSIVQNAGTSALCVQDSQKLFPPLCSAVTYVSMAGSGSGGTGSGTRVGMFATLPTYYQGQEVTTATMYAVDGSAMIDITKLVGVTLAFEALNSGGANMVVQPN